MRYLPVAMLLASCGGSGGSDSNNALNDGYFLDSAVEGLEYRRYIQTGVDT
jgi:hypothetical protein